MAGGMAIPGEKKGGPAETWPLWKLALIALPQLSVQVLWCFIGPNSAPYMDHLGASPMLATLNNIAGPITGFFTGPLVGAISDSCTSPLGRRRPVILVGLASLWMAGMLFASSEHIFSKDFAIYFAAPMYWIMDVTINILQTPHRALVSDLATDEQQIPMQVMFVFFMSIGNFIAFGIMKIYPIPVEHMLELMFGICLLNTVIIGIQFLVAKETPLKAEEGAPKQSACAPVKDVVDAVKGSPRLLYHLAFIQCLVWVGNTSWNLYAGMWFTDSVYEGNKHAAEGSIERQHWVEGNDAFSTGGMMKAVVQLISTLAIIGLLLNTNLRPRTVYAPCIFIGVIVSVLAAFFVGHNGWFADITMAISVMPETGSFAIPFGLIATLNQRAAAEGKHVSTALQMALLNCCVTVGQQVCTLTLAGFLSSMSLVTALPLIFMVAALAQGVAGVSTLFLDDAPEESGEPTTSGSDSEEDSSAETSAVE